MTSTPLHDEEGPPVSEKEEYKGDPTVITVSCRVVIKIYKSSSPN